MEHDRGNLIVGQSMLLQGSIVDIVGSIVVGNVAGRTSQRHYFAMISKTLLH